MTDSLIDTNVFSRIFKGDAAVKGFVESLTGVIDTTVYIECLQGSKSNREKQIVESYLSRFPIYPLMPSISVRTIDLIRTYSNTKGLLLADALIAAACLKNDLTLVTYNIGDFNYIQDLIVLRPPL
jgi:predicted nucleic acid-binding protein